jgi:outer membrane receptor protein involved in Fe transport
MYFAENLTIILRMKLTKRFMSNALLMLTLVLVSATKMQAQTVIKGTIKSSKDVIGSAQVVVKGTGISTFTNAKGAFELKTKTKPPFAILITAAGYETQEVNVTEENQTIDTELKSSTGSSNDIVVSATRAPIRILESPVSIERVSAAAIRNAPASNYYDALANVKGVDITTSSLTFKTPSTRGFNGSGNLRFNQIIDGMDNQAPGLNFSVGSVIGLTELDVDNMELLPGASSALYGSGGMNGTLLINSKSPFKQEGLSFQVKHGIMNTDNRYRKTSPFINWDMRYAKKITDKLAIKITSEFIHAKDWVASDTLNYIGAGNLGAPGVGTRLSDPNYNGVNTYGDEASTDIVASVLKNPAFVSALGPLLSQYQTQYNALTAQPIRVSRNGYREIDLVNPNTVNFKLGGAINYKITNNVEAILQGYFGTGNTVYTGSDRYSLRNLRVAQYKAEVKGLDWYLRAYTTQENSGDSYNVTATTVYANDFLKSNSNWFSTYGQTYFFESVLNGATSTVAHARARAAAQAGMPAVNSPQFKQAFDIIRKRPIGKDNGGLFTDKSDFYNFEGQYNLTKLVNNAAEIVVGGNYKIYDLNSKGTLFVDTAGNIQINEFGGYVQIAKAFLDNKLKITASGRYDKNSNFKGRFTPRATLLYKVAESKNIRLSYQTAYRFPSTQQQYINLLVGGTTQLIGGLPDFIRFFNLENSSSPVYRVTQVAGGAPVVATTPYKFGEFKPESLTSFELGYKGLHVNKKLLVDVFGYYGQYTNFINRFTYSQPATGKIFSIAENSIADKVTTYGFGLGLDYKLPKNFGIGFNVSSDNIQDAPIGAGFNTPKFRTNLTVSNNGFGKENRLGFSVVYKYQDKFYYESDFMSGNIAAIHTLDAQVSYKIPNSRSTIKLGGTNILNQYYVNAMGNPSVGALYYISYGFNVY